MNRHPDVSPPEKAIKQPYNQAKMLAAVAEVNSREALAGLAKEARDRFDEEWGCDPTSTEWVFAKSD